MNHLVKKMYEKCGEVIFECGFSTRSIPPWALAEAQRPGHIQRQKDENCKYPDKFCRKCLAKLKDSAE
jgi:hypothetical protein